LAQIKSQKAITCGHRRIAVEHFIANITFLLSRSMRETPKPKGLAKIWREIERPFKGFVSRATSSIDAKLDVIVHTLDQQRQEITALCDDFRNKLDQQRQEIIALRGDFRNKLDQQRQEIVALQNNLSNISADQQRQEIVALRDDFSNKLEQQQQQEIVSLWNGLNHLIGGQGYLQQMLEKMKICLGATSLTSFSQFGEDILLYKFLSHVQQGFYIDIGCYDWRKDNVGLFFYERGWHGINIDAQAECMENYHKFRKRDLNLIATLSDTDNLPTTLYLKGELTSNSAESVQWLKQSQNLQFEERKVATSRFDTLIASQTDFSMPVDVHWLKVDVEAHEKEVLSGMDWSTFRPWVVMVESTLPTSTTPSHETFEHIFLENNYKFFGLFTINRIYLAEEKAEELEQNFRQNAALLFRQHEDWNLKEQ